MSFVEGLSVAVAVAAVAVAAIAIFMMRTERRNRIEKPAEAPRVEYEGHLPFKIRKSVAHSEVEDAKNKLRILGLEREILSYAIRRLYEAQAEGKISEAERDNLSQRYKEEMMRANEEISRGESVIALNELEGMQEDLFRLFNERFDQLNRRVEDLRARSGIEPIETLEPIEEEKPISAELSKEEMQVKERKKREPSKKESTTPEKSEAEKKVEQIMTEVEKVLARLEQMEVSE